jgi:hypothetical protein
MADYLLMADVSLCLWRILPCVELIVYVLMSCRTLNIYDSAFGLELGLEHHFFFSWYWGLNSGCSP